MSAVTPTERAQIRADFRPGSIAGRLLDDLEKAEQRAAVATSLLSDAIQALVGHDEGCGCVELCSMGPTCPGGILAGLSGSGCHRTQTEGQN